MSKKPSPRSRSSSSQRRRSQQSATRRSAETGALHRARKQADEALLESETLFQKIFEMAADGIVLSDLKVGRFHLANKACLDMLGYTLSEFQQIDLDDLHFPEDLPSIHAEIAKFNRGETLERVETRFRYKDGRLVLIEISPTAVRLDGKTYALILLRDITARRQAEEALRASEERLALAASGAGIGMFEWDTGTDKISCSEQYLRLLGFSTTETTAAATTFSQESSYGDWARRVHPDDLPLAEAELHRSMDEHSPYSTEYRIVWPDGSLHWIADRGLFHYGPDGNPERCLGMIVDITDRKEASEARLHQSKMSYRRLFETAQDGILILDARSGEILDANPFLLGLLGYSMEELLGKKAWELGVFEDSQRSQEAFVKLREERYIRYDNLPLRAKDGRLIQVEFINNVYGTDHKKVIQCNIRDISARKRAEAMIQAAAREWRETFDSVPDAVILLDNDQRVLRCNEVARKMFGKPFPEIIGQSCCGLLHGTAGPISECPGTKMKTSLRRESIEFERNGRWYQVIADPQFGPENQLRGCVHVLRDITEHKQAEEVLKRDKETSDELVLQQTGALLEAERNLLRIKRLSDIGILAATVAHELRNPLGVIRLAAYNIKKGDEAGAYEKHLGNIEKKILQSEDIIKNLLSYSKVKAPEFARVDLGEILGEVIDVFRGELKKKEITFSIEPAALEGYFIDADRNQIAQLFSNLLDNAYHSLPHKKGEIGVSLRYDKAANRVEILIKDNGVGMNEETLAKLFEPFFTKKARGTGLGLTVCKQIVDLHDGTLGVQSKEGEGTEVRVALPMFRTLREGS